MRARASGIVVGIGVAIAVGAWLLIAGGGGPGPANEGSGAERGEPGAQESPGLATAPTPPLPAPRRASSGHGAIVGVAKREGVPVAATVEARRHPEDESRSGAWEDGRAAFTDRDLRLPDEPVVLATTQAGEDGRFALEGLAAGSYLLRALADGARADDVVSIPAEGARVEQNLDLVASGETLRGRVVHADGTPWTGAVVVEQPSSAAPDVVVRTDEAGRFAVGGLPKGEVVASAVEPGVLRVRGPEVRLPREGEVSIVVDASVRRLEGRVVAAADGSPVAGAALHAESADEDAQVRGSSGADGGFRLDLPNGKRARLTVIATGFAVSTLDVGAAAPIEVRLVHGAALSGRVLSAADGKPIAGAHVRACASEEAPGSRWRADEWGNRLFASMRSATTGADGRYALDGLFAGSVVVRVSARGFVAAEAAAGTSAAVRVTVNAGQEATCDVRLVPGVRATGRVLDPGGAPVPGAVVQATLHAGRDVSYIAAMLDDPGAMLLGREDGPEEATSATDGTFTVEGLRSDVEYDFAARAPGWNPGRGGPVAARAGAPVAVEIRLEPPRSLDVTVLDAGSGAPIAGATIAARATATLFPESVDGAWSTGADGRAQVGPVPHEPLRLTVSAQRHERTSEIEVALDEDAIVVRLGRGFTIAGRVVRPDGSPASGVEVYCFTGADEHETSHRAHTADDGTFRIEGVPAGTVDLYANEWTGGRSTTTNQRVEAGSEDVVLTLSAGGSDGARARLVVRVLGGDGRPVPRARVTFDPGSQTSADALDGVAEMEVGTGAGTVEVSDARAADGTPLPWGPERVEGVVAGGAEVVVHLPPERAISGRVVDDAGKGVGGVLVSATRGEGGEDLAVLSAFASLIGGRGASTVRTDAAGAFRIGGLADDAYRLATQPPRDWVAESPVRARGGDSAVRLVVRRGVAATVTVLDPDGKPVAKARVLAVRTREGGSTIDPDFAIEFLGGGNRTGPDGTVRIPGLDPGAKYALRVRPPDGRKDVRERVVEPWTVRDETVRLERAHSVRGVVRDLAGKPVEGASIQRKDADGDWGDAGVGATDAEGRFAIDDLGGDPVTVRARVGSTWRERSGATSGEIVVTPGSGEVVLTLDPGLTLTAEIGAASGVSMWLFQEEDGEWTELDRARNAARATFRGLRADATYAVWAHASEAGTYGWRTGLRAGGPRVRVDLVPGMTIEVGVRGPAGADIWVAARREGIHVEGESAGPGRWRVRGLPAGTWTVSANGHVGDAWWDASAEVEAGGSVDLEMVPSGR